MDCECRWTDKVLDSRLNDSFTAVKLLLDRLEHPYPRRNISELHSPLWDSRNPPLAERPHNNAPRIGKSVIKDVPDEKSVGAKNACPESEQYKRRR